MITSPIDMRHISHVDVVLPEYRVVVVIRLSSVWDGRDNRLSRKEEQGQREELWRMYS